MSIDDRVYPNLIRVFYQNMKFFINKLDKIITNVRGALIEFNVVDLNQIIGTKNTGHKTYTSRKALMFANFFHPYVVQK